MNAALDAPPSLKTRATFVDGSGRPDVSVIIVSYNTRDLLLRCLDRLRDAVGNLRVQVVVVDNASRDGSADHAQRHVPDATVIANTTNVGFGRANNQALAACAAPLLLLLNSDAFPYPGTLQRSVAHMQSDPSCGVLGARLVDESGQGGRFSARRFPDPWHDFCRAVGFVRSEPEPPQQGVVACDWVVGCYYLVRRNVIDRVGLFDPRYFLYMEEVDHCLTVQLAGWRVVCLMDVQVMHIGGASAASDGQLDAGRQLSALQVESGLLYYRKHRGVAGVLVHCTLSSLAALVVAAKGILRRRPLGAVMRPIRDTGTLARLALYTRLGARPVH